VAIPIFWVRIFSLKYSFRDIVRADVVIDYRRLHTVAEDTLGKSVTLWDGKLWLRCASLPYPDLDDLIFPRTTTRVGAKYQAVIPAKDRPHDQGGYSAGVSSTLSFWPGTQEACSDIQERGGEATVEVSSLVHLMSDTQGGRYASCK